MKHKILNAALGSVLLLLGACSEGQYWEEPGDYGTTPVFPKPSQTMVFSVDDEIPTTMSVTVARATAGPAATVPVEIVANDASASVLSGPAEVTFEAGSSTAEYVISINPENMSLGTNYSIKLNLGQPENAPVKYPAGNYSYTFTLMQDYKWVSAGTAKCLSLLVGNLETEQTIDVQVQEAEGYDQEGQRLFRLVSPYYVMGLEKAQEGYNIRFITTDSGDALELGARWQEIGKKTEDNGNYYIGTGYGDCGFFSEDGEYLIYGVIAYDVPGEDGLYFDSYEYFDFFWTCPAQ